MRSRPKPAVLDISLQDEINRANGKQFGSLRTTKNNLGSIILDRPSSVLRRQKSSSCEYDQSGFTNKQFLYEHGLPHREYDLRNGNHSKMKSPPLRLRKGAVLNGKELFHPLFDTVQKRIVFSPYNVKLGATYGENTLQLMEKTNKQQQYLHETQKSSDILDSFKIMDSTEIDHRFLSALEFSRRSIFDVGFGDDRKFKTKEDCSTPKNTSTTSNKPSKLEEETKKTSGVQSLSSRREEPLPISREFEVMRDISNIESSFSRENTHEIHKTDQLESQLDVTFSSDGESVSSTPIPIPDLTTEDILNCFVDILSSRSTQKGGGRLARPTSATNGVGIARRGEKLSPVIAAGTFLQPRPRPKSAAGGPKGRSIGEWKEKTVIPRSVLLTEPS